MTIYKGKTVSWLLYPDLVLPPETDITIPRQVMRHREREAFIQNQRTNYSADDSKRKIATAAISGMLALLNPPGSASQPATTPLRGNSISPKAQ